MNLTLCRVMSDCGTCQPKLAEAQSLSINHPKKACRKISLGIIGSAALAHPQYDFAEVLARLHNSMGLASLRKRQRFVDGRAQASGPERRAKLPDEASDDFGLFVSGSWTQGRTHNLDVPAQDCREIDFGARPPHQTDQHEVPARRERVDIFGEIGAADTVEDHVGATAVSRRPDLGREGAGLVVDRDVGTEAQTLPAFFV